MGYTVLHKKTLSNDPWTPHNVRGGWPHYCKVSGLKPYTNYSLRVTPYSFQAAGLIGPIAVLETLEDGTSVFFNFYYLTYMYRAPTKVAHI